MARLARMCASQLPTTAGHDVDILGLGHGGGGVRGWYRLNEERKRESPQWAGPGNPVVGKRIQLGVGSRQKCRSRCC
jgi:hypothetical protein